MKPYRSPTLKKIAPKVPCPNGCRDRIGCKPSSLTKHNRHCLGGQTQEDTPMDHLSVPDKPEDELPIEVVLEHQRGGNGLAAGVYITAGIERQARDAIRIAKEKELQASVEELVLDYGEGGREAPTSDMRPQTAWNIGSANKRSLGSRSSKPVSEIVKYPLRLGREAGSLVAETASDKKKRPKRNAPDRADKFFPFVNGADFDLAEEMIKCQWGKGKIDRFLRKKALKEELNRFKSWDSAEGLYDLIDIVPDGMPCHKWSRDELHIELESGTKAPFTLYYRDPIEIVRYLMGNPAFEKELKYAPEQHYHGEGEDRCRIYNEMYTANHWWRMQGEVGPGETVVEIIFSSDKTHLSEHQGDVKAWPVYMTIGNLNGAMRRSQKLPGTVLLGLLPIMKGGEKIISSKGTKAAQEDKVKMHEKCRVWHEAVGIMMKKLMEQGREEPTRVRCADGQMRECRFVLAGCIADYEEQVVVTGVASGVNCPICHVLPNEREDLWDEERQCVKSWEKRTHISTRTQRVEQLACKTPKEIEELKRRQGWMNQVENFAWDHDFVNIHDTIMMDSLHVLHKGLLIHLLKWLKHLGAEKYEEIRRDPRQDVSLWWDSMLDKRFRQAPRGTGLKLYKHFSSGTNWTGGDSRQILRQIVPVIAPLLGKVEPRAVLFTRALVELSLLVDMRTHDDETLGYIAATLKLLHTLRDVFRNARKRKKPGKNGELEEYGDFNFPKWHALTHYIERIIEFGCCDGQSTSPFEHEHVAMKEDYTHTNRQSFEEPILEHNHRYLNIRCISHRMDERTAKQQKAADKIQEAKEAGVITYAVPRKYTDFKGPEWEVKDADDLLHRKYFRRPDHYRSIKRLAQCLDRPDLIQEVATFVTMMRRRRKGETVTDKDWRHVLSVAEGGSRWAEELFAKIIPSVVNWNRNGKDPTNGEELSKDITRCTPCWHGTSEWRRDTVWIQAHPPQKDESEKNDGETEVGQCSADKSEAEDRAAAPHHGRVVGRLQIILEIYENESGSGARHQPYVGALIDLFDWVRQGRYNKVTGMAMVQEKSRSTSVRRNELSNARFHTLDAVLGSVDLWPTSINNKDKTFYVSPYTDFENWQDLFPGRWKEKRQKFADKLCGNPIERGRDAEGNVEQAGEDDTDEEDDE